MQHDLLKDNQLFLYLRDLPALPKLNLACGKNFEDLSLLRFNFSSLWTEKKTQLDAKIVHYYEGTRAFSMHA